MSEYYIGLMSGTSIDGIDAVLVDFSQTENKSLTSQNNLTSKIVDYVSVDFDEALKQTLHSLCTGTDNEIEKSGTARVKLAEYEAEAVNKLLKKAGIDRKDVVAAGCHGQTIRHRPEKGFSIQLDDGPRVAALTGIDVINNFRASDIACGGNGAPLTQAFHRIQFASDDRVSMVLNLGGIANLTVIDKNLGHSILQAFDTGPANTLIDTATRLLLKKPFDRNGETARQGKVIPALLAKYLSEPYLQLPPPKSTGRETFNPEFIAEELLLATQDRSFIPDLIATLTEFTVVASVNAIRQCLFRYRIDSSRLILCGGGAYNSLIFERFTEMLKKQNVDVVCADTLGVNSKLIEAHAFAFFAYMFCHGKPLDLGHSTGADRPSILGCLNPKCED